MKSHNTQITLSQIEKLRSNMVAMPTKEKTEFNMREAVKSLEAEIHLLMSERGYTVVDIAKMFNEAHVSATANTIAAYLREPAAVVINNKKGAISSKKTVTSSKIARSEVVVSTIARPQAPMVTIGENAAPVTLAKDDQVIGDQATASSALDLANVTGPFANNAEAAVQTETDGQLTNHPQSALPANAEADESRSFLDFLHEDEVPPLPFGAK